MGASIAMWLAAFVLMGSSGLNPPLQYSLLAVWIVTIIGGAYLLVKNKDKQHFALRVIILVVGVIASTGHIGRHIGILQGRAMEVDSFPREYRAPPK